MPSTAEVRNDGIYVYVEQADPPELVSEALRNSIGRFDQEAPEPLAGTWAVAVAGAIETIDEIFDLDKAPDERVPKAAETVVRIMTSEMKQVLTSEAHEQGENTEVGKRLLTLSQQLRD